MSERRWNRRTFLASGTLAAAGMTPPGALASQSPAEQERIQELARQTPIPDSSDVLVCGAGPAGVAAAIAAARAGAKTRLIDVNGCLGGTWTAGLLSWIIDAGRKAGIIQEILRKLKQRDALADYQGHIGYDVEAMKLLLEDMCGEAGVHVHLHTRVVAAVKDVGNRLTHAVTESKSGREAWAAKVFVDASGDGDLAALAGCGFDYGSEETHQLQPLSMIGLLVGLKLDDVAPFVSGTADSRKKPTAKDRLLAEMRRAGVAPSYAAPTLFYIHKDLYCLMANHEYGVSAASAEQITQATIRGRAEVHRLVNALRALGNPWGNVQLVATAEQIGVREGRRIHGLYTVSKEDLIEGKRHDDAVCRVNFGADIHSPDPHHSKTFQDAKVNVKPYDIPYRAMIARDVSGLLLAGRCISGDFVAHSSYRVTGNAATMGEAAGVAAALAVKQNRFPQDVPWNDIRAALPSKG